MQGLTESCSICSRPFTVQFSYQMEERDSGFVFYCSQECQGRSLRGEVSGGVTCACCNKIFLVEYVSQVVRVHGERSYACSDACRAQLRMEEGGAGLGSVSGETARSVPVSAGGGARLEAPADVPASRECADDVLRVSPAVRAIDGPRKLAIFNHKGGTGKTTTSVSVAAGLAAQGRRVLLVDTDSQGNVAVSLDVKAKLSLYHVLVMGMSPKQAAVNVRPNLDVLVANETLAAAELYLAGRNNRDRVLRERLLPALDAYDVVVVDCSPSLSLLNQNALVFADGILVPVACDFLSLVGVRQVVKTVKNVNSLLHHPVTIYGVLPTFYDARARISRDAVETLRSHFGDRCFEPVRAATRLKEAPAQGKTIFEYAPDSNAAEDYRAVVERIITGGIKQTTNDEPAMAVGA